MKRLLAILIALMLLLLTACGSGDPAQSVETDDALSVLRGEMKPPVMAVADFFFPELTEEFGVMSIPTIVVVKDGQVAGQAVGMRSKAQILKLLE